MRIALVALLLAAGAVGSPPACMDCLYGEDLIYSDDSFDGMDWDSGWSPRPERAVIPAAASHSDIPSEVMNPLFGRRTEISTPAIDPGFAVEGEESPRLTAGAASRE